MKKLSTSNESCFERCTTLCNKKLKPEQREETVAKGNYSFLTFHFNDLKMGENGELKKVKQAF